MLKKCIEWLNFNKKAWLKPYIDIKNGLRKKKIKMILRKTFSSWITQFLVKLWKMWENIKIKNLEQQRKGKTI